MSRRQSRYLIQMSVRVVAFLLAVLTWNHIPHWVSLVLIVAAVVLPYVAVLFANAGRERDDDDVSYLGPRELGAGHDDLGGLGPAPHRGPESDA
jgi:predicted exporter